MALTDITAEEVERLARDHHGLRIKATALNGYDELNFICTDAQSRRYILKVAEEAHGVHFLDAQVRILNHLAASPVSAYFQRYLLNHDGEEVTRFWKGDSEYFLRILTYLEGEFYVDHAGKSPALAAELGDMLGRMDLALRDFSHPAMHRRYTWDISTALDARARVKYIKDPERRRMAGHFLMQFEVEVAPVLSSLRHAYIHNDANDWNVLVRDGHIAGLIDFGDMVHSALINNVAVACTYVMLGRDEPLTDAAALVGSYHARYPLHPEELRILYWLIAGRLCISVTQSAYNAAQDSDNEHHFITERPAWKLLYQWIRINPMLAEDTFLRACGMNGVITTNDHASLLKERRDHVGRNLSISYKEKIKVLRGALQYLYDDKGRTFVDCVNNPSHVGHGHPVVVDRMRKQITTLNTNTRYLSDLIVDYARELTSTLPPELRVCYFVNSGSEANDLAIRMSRHFTGRQDVIVLDHAYHGTSTLTMEISPYKFDQKAGFGQRPWVHKALSPDLYRGPYQYDDVDAGRKYADDVRRIIDQMKDKGVGPAAFICESLLGVGGQMPLPEGYLAAVYAHVRAAGGLCIADEVQVGFGRVGDAFWGFELQGVIPDIVVMGKPIGNGHPLAAVVVTEAIAASFDNGLEYFNTYGGNPVAAAAANAVLDVIERDQLIAHAARVGTHLADGLRALATRHACIGDVRGLGLFVGVELVSERLGKTPDAVGAARIVNALRRRRILISASGSALCSRRGNATLSNTVRSVNNAPC